MHSNWKRMEGSEDLDSSLLTQPWASVCFGESTFIAKACFRETGYVLLISDLSSVWYERADTDVIGKRSKELNKRLTAHVSSFLNRLSNLMCPLLEGRESDANSFSCQQTPSKLTIHVKSELSGLPFYWDFHCPAAAVEMISRHLVRPLIRMSLALQYQLQELASLLVQKDVEIEDYRESGAALSRESAPAVRCRGRPGIHKHPAASLHGRGQAGGEGSAEAAPLRGCRDPRAHLVSAAGLIGHAGLSAGKG
ncbi:non-homologous end-joining factor 1 isoform X4 [Mauremys mutica]|uniref:non-homologous end-joining factor 1 isoform X4 n=1 Tax=Mauremys mutica TaxID=74926 RepID=UPI001D1570F0|nr:non-homologous end-joining factor 1 isoform X4 [Mauremys mutica]